MGGCYAIISNPSKKEGVVHRNRGFAKGVELGYSWKHLVANIVGAKFDNWVEIVTLENKMG